MDLFEQAKSRGVETSLVDGHGQQHTADEELLRAVFQALPQPPATALRLPPIIADAGHGVSLSRNDLAGKEWTIIDAHGIAIGSGVFQQDHIKLPPAPAGVFRLEIGDGEASNTTLISAPAQAFAGDFDRVWLLAVQLYSVRSERNWGIGDFSDLATLIEWAKHTGAAGIGLNPLHVLCDDRPDDCSPYSPNSRLFLNPLYIDVTKAPGFFEGFYADNEGAIAAARKSELIDYAAVAGLKMTALRAAYQAFSLRGPAEEKARFDDFRERRPLIARFASFEVLRRKYQGPWWEWPDGWNHPDDVALAALRQGEDAAEIEYYEFMQWCAHEQLTRCAALADSLKLPIGLYLDIAVGVKADGFDAWNEPHAISRHLSVGAPPDLLNTAGQNWGLAGFNSAGLELTMFAPFRDMLRASMQYAGAIRLDHVLGLNRLYLVPAGYPADRGVYVRMPLEELLAVTAIESEANRCIVIGEDLGTVPAGFREKLAKRAIWSYRVMMFERDEAGFHPLDSYPRNSLVTFNTHDLPTYLGWMNAHDIELKLGLGLDPGETTEVRALAVGMLRHTLGEMAMSDQTIYPVLDCLSCAGSRLLAVSIEDLLSVLDQPNIPGTINQHPNWRRRLPYNIEELQSSVDNKRLRDVLKDRVE
ncbi:4-alpha-glucanotransferase [Afipia sp. Root123D2]|nr:4-alpha-glucanotransferase [Afipia sp. Root123D2]KQW20929.1 4-alpha-glucanotransferase [Afipia sp. Root123D2]